MRTIRNCDADKRIVLKVGSATSQKMKSVSGESIGETLIALLISVLALTLLAGAITTSSNIVNRSKIKLGQYYNKNNSMMSGSAPSDGTATITRSGASDTSVGSPVSIKYYTNDEFANGSVIMYEPN